MRLMRDAPVRQYWLLQLGACLCLLACLAWAAPALAQPVAIPELNQRVTDTTGTLDAATQSRLTQTLAELEQRKGAQIAVLMIPTTGDEGIDQYAVRAFEQWKLGREAVDDGILFLVAKDDRRLRIEVGYGLEGAVPDLLAGRIIREQVAPRFQQGDFSGGVVAGVDSLIKLVDGEDLPPPVSAESSGSSLDYAGLEDKLGLGFLLLMVVMALPTVFAVIAAVVITFFVSGSVVLGILAGMAAFLISLARRAMSAGPSGAHASRRGGVIGGIGAGAGWGGFRGGGGFGGGGGGGFGGGGGSSGGGGASGSW